MAVVLIGGLQHRLAGLGHEASHYTLLRNKLLNDLVGDVFCMFPIFATVHFYRLFHLAHHQYTNDPGCDPDLVEPGREQDGGPVPDVAVGIHQGVLPPAVHRAAGVPEVPGDYIDINVLGRSENVYLRRVPGLGESGRAWPRLGATLGLVYLVAVHRGPVRDRDDGAAGLAPRAGAWPARCSSWRAARPARPGLLPVAVPPAALRRFAGHLRLGYYSPS